MYLRLIWKILTSQKRLNYLISRRLKSDVDLNLKLNVLPLCNMAARKNFDFTWTLPFCHFIACGGYFERRIRFNIKANLACKNLRISHVCLNLTKLDKTFKNVLTKNDLILCLCKNVCLAQGSRTEKQYKSLEKFYCSLYPVNY